MSFDLINQILRNPETLIQDEASWQAARVRQAIEQIPADYFVEKFQTTAKKPGQIRVALYDWAKRQNGRLCSDGGDSYEPAASSRPATSSGYNQPAPSQPSPRRPNTAASSASSDYDSAPPPSRGHPSQSSISFGGASGPSPGSTLNSSANFGASQRMQAAPAPQQSQQQQGGRGGYNQLGGDDDDYPPSRSMAAPGNAPPSRPAARPQAWADEEPSYSSASARSQSQSQSQAPAVDSEAQGDRYSQLKSRRDALIVRVYEMKREIEQLQRQMDQIDSGY